MINPMEYVNSFNVPKYLCSKRPSPSRRLHWRRSDKSWTKGEGEEGRGERTPAARPCSFEIRPSYQWLHMSKNSQSKLTGRQDVQTYTHTLELKLE